jgi:K+/H+ antiporter YhaU regulatory subunit KhtT
MSPCAAGKVISTLTLITERMAQMEALLMTLAAIGVGAGIVFVARQLGEAQARVNLLKAQRRQDWRRQ